MLKNFLIATIVAACTLFGMNTEAEANGGLFRNRSVQRVVVRQNVQHVQQVQVQRVVQRQVVVKQQVQHVQQVYVPQNVVRVVEVPSYVEVHAPAVRVQVQKVFVRQNVCGH